MVGKAQKSHGRDLNCMAFSKPKSEFNSDLVPCDFGLFHPWKWSSETRNFEVINGQQHVFEKWV
jgi:hypothetical protein